LPAKTPTPRIRLEKAVANWTLKLAPVENPEQEIPSGCTFSTGAGRAQNFFGSAHALGTAAMGVAPMEPCAAAALTSNAEQNRRETILGAGRRLRGFLGINGAAARHAR
jgi:hypothetical protein